MAMTITNATGDGISVPLVAVSVALPDSGTSVPIVGRVQPAAGTAVTVTGSPVTIPAAPGSGSIYYVIQINTTTGAATMKQSTSAMPTADAGNIVVFQQTLGTTSSDPALVATSVTPDTY